MGPHQDPTAQPLAQRLLQEVLEADGIHGGVLGQDEPLDGDDGAALPLALGPQRLDDHVQGGGVRGPPALGQQTLETGCAGGFGCWERREEPLGTLRHSQPQGLQSHPRSQAAMALLIPPGTTATRAQADPQPQPQPRWDPADPLPA